MKKLLLSLALCLAAGGTMRAQYQVQNGDFESWKASSGEPDHWHGFKSAKGSLASMAKGTLEKSTDVRPGTSGSSSALITAGSVLGVVNNGTFTTGQLQADNMSAANTANHAEMDKTSTATDKNGDKFYMPLVGHPDAMKVWLKFTQKTTNKRYPYASASAVLFDGSYYQDPENKTYTNIVAKASNTTITTCGWTEFNIPFVYTNNNVEPEAILVTFGTNATPGKGSSGDQVFVDDLELIYNSELTSAKYDGNSITFVNGAAAIDEYYDEGKLTDLVSNGRAASIAKDYDEATAVLTITVSGEDVSENASNVHNYTIQFRQAAPAEKITASYRNNDVTFTDNKANVDAVYYPGELVITPADESYSVRCFYDGETGLLTISLDEEQYTIQFEAPVSSKSYTEYLVVDVDGNKTEPKEASMIMYDMSDGSKTLVLKNFVLTESENDMPVGNISLAGVVLSSDGSFETVQSINISNGDDSQDFWLGPMLGIVPVEMTGTISEDKFIAHIDITMEELDQIIEVFFGYSYSRDGLTEGNWGTICQPFSFSAETVSNTGVKFYSIAGKDVNGKYISLTEVEDGLEAGVPYLFKAAGSTLELLGGTAYASAPVNDSANGLIGVFAQKDVPSDCYILHNNMLAKGTGNTVAANRAYIDLSQVSELEGDVKGIRFYIEGTDGINAITNIDNGSAVYNLAGQRVVRPAQRGVYVVNGKKVLVK